VVLEKDGKEYPTKNTMKEGRKEGRLNVLVPSCVGTAI